MVKCAACGCQMERHMAVDHPCVAMRAVHAWLQRHRECSCDSGDAVDASEISAVPDWVVSEAGEHATDVADFQEQLAKDRFEKNNGSC